MILEGDRSVITALKEKKRLIAENKPHDHLKILLICDGGLIKGAYSVGVGLALEELGYTNVFTDVVGVSSGAPSVAYFLGGNVSVGGSLIYEECCSARFIQKFKFWNMTNITFIIDVLRGLTGKGLLYKKIFTSPTKLHIAVTDHETALPLLVSPKDDEELLGAIRASILMPHMSPAKAYVAGRRCVDGGFSDPHILAYALKKIPHTHALILTSQNYRNEKIEILESFLCSVVFRHRFSRKTLDATLKRKFSRSKALEYVQSNHSGNCLLVWGDGSIGGVEQDAVRIKEVVERYRREWLRVMTDEQ